MTNKENVPEIQLKGTRFLTRFPFVVLNSISFLGLINGFKSIPSYIGDWIMAWNTVTQKIWSLIFTVEIPVFLSTYLTMTVITVGGFYRIFNHLRPGKNNFPAKILSLLILKTYILFWPFIYIGLFPLLFNKKNEYRESREVAIIFLEFMIFSLVIIALAYVVFFITET